MSLLNRCVARHVLLAMAAAAVVACGGGADAPAVDTGTAGGDVGPGDTMTPPSEPRFEGGTDPVRRAGAGGMATLTAVRAAPRQAEPFERVVFEFDQQLPGYEVSYAEETVSECGSGRDVSVAGSAVLTVRFDPAQAHAERGGEMQSTLAERDLRLNQPLVRQLTLTCDFEGQVGWALGLAERRPFRVMELQGPPRIVVDMGSTP